MNWIRTYTGKQFWPLMPRIEDIDIEDIAHSLSMQCRFGGHARYHYSVAQHCVLICERTKADGLTTTTRLAALLHDASEAYLVDFPRPVKQLMPEYAVAEERLQSVIHRRFQVDVDDKTAALIKKLDDAILYDESRALFKNGFPFVDQVQNVTAFTIERWKPKRAKKEFMERFKSMTLGRY